MNDLGREDARRIRESNNPNTRYIDKPLAPTSNRLLSDAMSRQQAVIRNMQRQVLGEKAVSPLAPSGRFAAPSIPRQQSLVFKRGSVRLQPPMRGNLLTTVAGVGSEFLTQPIVDAISDNVIFPLMEKAFGRELPTSAELRQKMELEQQNPQQVVSAKDEVLDALPQTSPEASVMPLNPIDDVDVSIEDSTPLEAIVEEASLPQSHSLSPEDDERNREYLILRAALGDNPTQEEMRAVVEYGLQQHRINLSHLYV